MHVFPGQIGAADCFALAMIGVSIVAMGMIGTLFFCMKRNVARRDPHVDALLEEIEADERQALAAGSEAPQSPAREAWERDSDWWKPRD